MLEFARHLRNDNSLNSPFNCIHQLCHGILEETGLHTCCTYTSDFLFCQLKDNRLFFHSPHFQHRCQRCICADTVILSIRHNHTVIQHAPVHVLPEPPHLCRHEVFFCHSIAAFSYFQELLLYAFLFLFASTGLLPTKTSHFSPSLRCLLFSPFA